MCTLSLRSTRYPNLTSPLPRFLRLGSLLQWTNRMVWNSLLRILSSTGATESFRPSLPKEQEDFHFSRVTVTSLGTVLPSVQDRVTFSTLHRGQVYHHRTEMWDSPQWIWGLDVRIQSSVPLIRKKCVYTYGRFRTSPPMFITALVLVSITGISMDLNLGPRTFMI